MNTRALVAEFIGTFALIFVGVGAIAVDKSTGGTSGLVGIALAHGLTIAIMASATAAISGGHLNPAVSLSLAAVRKLSFAQAIGNSVAQCLGATAGAALLYLAMPAELLSAVSMGTPAPGANVSVGQALVMEIVLTFFLVTVIFGTAVDPRAPKCGALFIGLAVSADIFIGGPISGAAMNPARHLGPALLGGGFEDFWIYWVGPILGALFAAIIYTRFLMERNSILREI